MSRFQTLVLASLVAVSSACAARGGPAGPIPQPFPQPGPEAAPAAAPEAPPDGPRAVDGYAIAGTALSLRGTPYRNGGSDPSGFDCSGFVWYVFSQHGIAVPRTVADQSQLGDLVSPALLGAGDLLFFNTKGAGPTHVGIAIGGDEFVHAPSSNGAVRVERLGSSYWSPRLIGARRITPRDAVPCASAGAHSCQ